MSNLNLQYRSKFGLDFPASTPDTFVHLLCAKCWRDFEGQTTSMLEPGEHLLRAIRDLFPTAWTISPWTEEHAHAWCNETCLGILGSAASSKSWDIGGFALLDWMTHPDCTVTLMASTSRLALADRTFASTIKLFRELKRHPVFAIPGQISKADMAIILSAKDSHDAASNDKTALRGVALQQGTAEEARGSLQGRHAPYVRLIIDELAAMKTNIALAAVDARTNLRIGAEKDFKFVYLANPESMLDTCGRISAPHPGGWGAVDVNTPRWRSRIGLVLRRNGLSSPAVVDPDGPQKYPYLIRQSQIDEIVHEEGGNPNSPRVWTMVYGFPPPQGLSNSVLTPTTIQNFNMADPPEWMPDTYYVNIAGLDPAFTAHGDGCALQFARIGWLKHGVFGIGFGPCVMIPLDAASKRPIVYQVVDQVQRHLLDHGVLVQNLCIDDSGTQSVADVIAVETGTQPMRLNFASKASETEGQPRFRNAVTEIWHLMASLGRERQIRGLSPEAQSQFCERRYTHSLVPLALESKIEYKKRVQGKSPDEGDAAALCCWAAHLLGLRPGSQGPVSQAPGNHYLGAPNKTLRPTYSSLDNARYSVYADT